MKIEISFGSFSTVVKELKNLMAANQAEVLAKMDVLTEAIVAEKSEVVAKISSLESVVAELKAQIEAGANLDAIVAKLDEQIAGVKGIFEESVPSPVEPPIE